MEQGRAGPSVAPEFPSSSSSLPWSSSSRRACVATSAPRVRRTHEGSRRQRAGDPALLHTCLQARQPAFGFTITPPPPPPRCRLPTARELAMDDLEPRSPAPASAPSSMRGAASWASAWSSGAGSWLTASRAAARSRSSLSATAPAPHRAPGRGRGRRAAQRAARAPHAHGNLRAPGGDAPNEKPI
jgi:hypothetical protein